MISCDGLSQALLDESSQRKVVLLAQILPEKALANLFSATKSSLTLKHYRFVTSISVMCQFDDRTTAPDSQRTQPSTTFRSK